MGNRDLHSGHTGCLAGLDGCQHSWSSAADDRLAVGIDVGHDDVARNRLDDPLDLGQGAEHGRHRPVVLLRDVSHLPAPGAYGFQRGVEAERPGRHEGSVLTEAVTHDHVRGDAVSGEQFGEGLVGGQHGRLGDLGLQELRLESGQRLLGLVVGEDVGAQRAPEQGGHDFVGVVVDGLHDRLGLAQRAEHVDVLRALPGVQEGHLGRRAATQEDALRAQHLPHRRGVGGQGLERPIGLGGEVGGVGEVNGYAHRAFGERRIWGADGRGLTGICRVAQCLELGGEIRVVATTQDSGSAQGGLALAGRQTRHHRGGGLLRGLASADRLPGDVLLKCHVEIRPAEAERAHAGAPGRIRGSPLAQFGVDAEGSGVPVDVGVGVDEVQAGWQHLVVQRHDRLEQARRTRRGLQVADVGLDRAERDRAGRGAGEHGVEGAQLRRVAHPGGRAMGLEHADGAWVHPG